MKRQQKLQLYWLVASIIAYLGGVYVVYLWAGLAFEFGVPYSIPALFTVITALSILLCFQKGIMTKASPVLGWGIGFVALYAGIWAIVAYNFIALLLASP